jgi:AraC-like DNA-binding protein
MLSKRNSLFSRIIYAYLLILVIPFMTTLLIINYTSNMFRTEVQRNSDVILKNIALSLDGHFNEMNQISKNIMKDQRFTIAQRKDPTDLNSVYSFVALANYLSIYTSPYYEDVFVYFNAADKLVSGKYATAKSRTYYQANYQNNVSSYEEWIYPLNINTMGSHYRTFTINNLPTITYLASYPQLYPLLKDTTSTIGIVFNATALQELLNQNVTQSYRREILICDRDNNVLITTNDDFKTVDIKNTLNQKEYHVIEVNGNEYVEQSYISSSTGCSYLIYTPTQYYWENVTRLQIILIVLFILFMILSAFISIRLARYTYSPVKGLVSAIQQKTQVENKSRDEISYIQGAVDVILKEKKILAVQLSTRATELVDDIFYKALLGVLPEHFDVIPILQNYHINIQEGNFSIALFQIIPPATMDPLPTSDEIKSIIESEYYHISSTSIRYFTTKTDQDKYAVVINTPPSSNLDRDIVEYTLAVKNSLVHMSLDVAISISPVHENVNELHIAYGEALKTLDYKTVYGIENILHFNDIRDKVFNYRHESLVHIRKHIELFIINNKDMLTAEELYSLIQKKCFDEANASLEVFTCFRYDLINNLSHIALELFSSKYINDNKIIHSLLETKSFEVFRVTFINILIVLQRDYQLERTNNELIWNVKEYIQLNYSNPNLSINALGAYFSLSPSYLSSQFKSQEGISPLEYISNIRLQKSKELLVSTDKVIEQIAMECGYLSSSVYIRSFKKAEGTTPGEYKKIARLTIDNRSNTKQER